MNTRSLVHALLVCSRILFPACSQESGSKRDESLAALAEKVREHREPTKIGGDVVVGLGLRKRAEEIPAYGKAVAYEPTKEIRAILVTEANEMVVMFGNASAEYWTLTDASGKLRKAFRAEPGQPQTAVPVSDVQPRFEKEIGFWKAYLGIPE